MGRAGVRRERAEVDKVAEGKEPQPYKLGLGTELMIKELKKASARNTKDPVEDRVMKLL